MNLVPFAQPHSRVLIWLFFLFYGLLSSSMATITLRSGEEGWQRQIHRTCQWQIEAARSPTDREKKKNWLENSHRTFLWPFSSSYWKWGEGGGESSRNERALHVHTFRNRPGHWRYGNYCWARVVLLSRYCCCVFVPSVKDTYNVMRSAFFTFSNINFLFSFSAERVEKFCFCYAWIIFCEWNESELSSFLFLHIRGRVQGLSWLWREKSRRESTLMMFLLYFWGMWHEGRRSFLVNFLKIFWWRRKLIFLRPLGDIVWKRWAARWWTLLLNFSKARLI